MEFIDVFHSFQQRIMLDLLSLSSAEAYIGWGGNWTVIWRQVVSGVFVPKNYQILITGFQVTVENVANAFWDTV